MRFLLAGGSTTAVSYLLYLLLLKPLGHTLSYGISFVVGVLWSYTINTWFVFRQRWNVRKLLQFPLVYLAQYLVAAALLELLVGWFGVPAQIAPLLIVVVTIPLTFVLSRRVLSDDKVDPSSDPGNTAGQDAL